MLLTYPENSVIETCGVVIPLQQGSAEKNHKWGLPQTNCLEQWEWQMKHKGPELPVTCCILQASLMIQSSMLSKIKASWDVHLYLWKRMFCVVFEIISLSFVSRSSHEHVLYFTKNLLLCSLSSFKLPLLRAGVGIRRVGWLSLAHEWLGFNLYFPIFIYFHSNILLSQGPPGVIPQHCCMGLQGKANHKSHSSLWFLSRWAAVIES